MLSEDMQIWVAMPEQLIHLTLLLRVRLLLLMYIMVLALVIGVAP